MTEQKYKRYKLFTALLVFPISYFIRTIVFKMTFEEYLLYDSIIFGALLIVLIYTFDFVMKLVYPEFMKKLTLPQTDERAQYLSGKASHFTLKLIAWITIIITYSLKINRRNSEVTFIAFGVLLIGVVYFLSYKYFEKKQY